MLSGVPLLCAPQERPPSTAVNGAQVFLEEQSMIVPRFLCLNVVFCCSATPTTAGGQEAGGGREVRRVYSSGVAASKRRLQVHQSDRALQRHGHLKGRPDIQVGENGRKGVDILRSTFFNECTTKPHRTVRSRKMNLAHKGEGMMCHADNVHQRSFSSYRTKATALLQV